MNLKKSNIIPLVTKLNLESILNNSTNNNYYGCNNYFI